MGSSILGGVPRRMLKPIQPNWVSTGRTAKSRGVTGTCQGLTRISYFFLGAESLFAARVRTCASTAWICSSVILPLKPGIFPFPSEMAWVSSASDLLWTSAERRSATFRLFPTAVPLPSCPWQVAHFDLKTSAPAALFWPAAGFGVTPMTTRRAAASANPPASGRILLRFFIIPRCLNPAGI